MPPSAAVERSQREARGLRAGPQSRDDPRFRPSPEATTPVPRADRRNPASANPSTVRPSDVTRSGPSILQNDARVPADPNAR